MPEAAGAINRETRLKRFTVGGCVGKGPRQAEPAWDPRRTLKVR